jgi:hypothetical protein
MSCSFMPLTNALEKPDVIDCDSGGSNDGTMIRRLKLSSAKMW